MVRTLKHSLLSTLVRSGFSGYIAGSRWRRRRLLILCYHGVARYDEHQWDPELYVTPAHLEKRLFLLRRNRCTVLPLDEAVARLYDQSLPERAVVLTFDDGYHDFLSVTWPLLKSYGYPATVYLTTHRVDRQLPNTGLFVSYVLWAAQQRTLDGRGILDLAGEYPLATPGQRQVVLDRLSAARSSAPEWKLDDAARQIAERVGFDYQMLHDRRLLTLLRPDEVARLAAEGTDFQLHTHLHRTPADADEFARDVMLNRRRIQELTGRQPEHLCYPSGNFRAVYPAALRRCGVVSATTCDPDLASRQSDPLRLPRFVDTSFVSDVVFESWLSGLAPYLPRRTRFALDEALDEPPLPMNDERRTPDVAASEAARTRFVSGA